MRRRNHRNYTTAPPGGGECACVRKISRCGADIISVVASTSSLVSVEQQESCCSTVTFPQQRSFAGWSCFELEKLIVKPVWCMGTMYGGKDLLYRYVLAWNDTVKEWWKMIEVITGWALALTCYISHSARHRKMADFDPSRSQNPWTDFDETWHGTPPHMTTLVGVAQRRWSGQICDLCLSNLWVSLMMSKQTGVTEKRRKWGRLRINVSLL